MQHCHGWRYTPEPMPQLARWLTFIEEFDYEIQHRVGRKHGNADKLSRRPDPYGDNDHVTGLPDEKEGEVAVLVRESPQPDDTGKEKEVGEPTVTGDGSSVCTDMAKWQRDDPEIGPIVKLRMNGHEKPEFSFVQAESECMKRLWNQ